MVFFGRGQKIKLSEGGGGKDSKLDFKTPKSAQKPKKIRVCIFREPDFAEKTGKSCVLKFRTIHFPVPPFVTAHFSSPFSSGSSQEILKIIKNFGTSTELYNINSANQEDCSAMGPAFDWYCL